MQAESNGEKDVKAFQKFKNIPLYIKTILNLRNSVEVRLPNKEKDYFRKKSKPFYETHTQKIDNDLVEI